MAVKIIGVGIAKSLSYRVEDFSVSIRIRELPSDSSGVEMSPVYNGAEDRIDLAKRDDLLKCAELIDLTHRFKTEPYWLIANLFKSFIKCIRGKAKCFLTRDLRRASRVDDDYIRAEQ